jgi:hypothetical protein
MVQLENVIMKSDLSPFKKNDAVFFFGRAICNIINDWHCFIRATPCAAPPHTGCVKVKMQHITLIPLIRSVYLSHHHKIKKNTRSEFSSQFLLCERVISVILFACGERNFLPELL